MAWKRKSIILRPDEKAELLLDYVKAQSQSDTERMPEIDHILALSNKYELMWQRAQIQHRKRIANAQLLIRQTASTQVER